MRAVVRLGTPALETDGPLRLHPHDALCRFGFGPFSRHMPRRAQLLAARWRPLTSFVATVVLLILCGVPAGADDAKVEINYIWPTATATFQVISDNPDESLETPKFMEKLADIAEAGFKRYVDEILPVELKKDKALQERWEGADVSRVNRAFLRWQKRIFSREYKISIADLNWDGVPMPYTPDISFQWDEFFKGAEYKKFRSLCNVLVNSYFSQVQPGQRREQMNFKIFAWAEVYPPGHNQRSHTHTGAPASGHFVARYDSNGSKPSQKFAMDDVRGLNAPFGQTVKSVPVEGEMMLWPSWLPHWFTPNRGEKSNVYISFSAYPQGGADEFDWEDDRLGDVVTNARATIRSKPKDKEEL